MNKAFNLKCFKKEAAQPDYRNSQPDFRNVDVRRLNGILLDFKSNASSALEEMEKWIANGEVDITFEEAQERLGYYMTVMGLK